MSFLKFLMVLPAVLPTIGIAVFLKQFGISRYLGPGNESSLLNLAHVEP